MQSVPQIFSAYLERKQKKNPRYSLRAAAIQSGISASHLSRILNGKKRPSLSTIVSLCQVLEIDDWGLNQLERSLDNRSNSNEALMPEEAEAILKDWKALAVLELADIDKIKVKKAQVASMLEIDDHEAETILKSLFELNLLEQDSEGYLKKSSKNIRFPALSSRKMIRNYHKSVMVKACETMTTNTNQSDYDKRLVTSMCLTVDSRKIAQAKKEIQKTLNKLASELSAEDTDSVYQMSFQLIPVARAPQTNSAELKTPEQSLKSANFSL